MAAIASAIRDDLDIKVLALSEINGEERQTDDGMRARSQELDALVALLGPTYAYEIGAAGGSQRVAMVYDRRFARLNAVAEIAVPLIKVGGKDIFARDPLAGHFTLLHNGAPQNDLLVVALHLASGQRRTANHDAAMRRLRRELNELRVDGVVMPTDEADLLLAGDLNASMFDNAVETFFTEMDQGSWDVLAVDPYPGTRLASVPLQPRSQIDYIIVSTVQDQMSGLSGEEITASAATVHHELADANDWRAFRQTYSDHFPVTTCVADGFG